MLTAFFKNLFLKTNVWFYCSLQQAKMKRCVNIEMEKSSFALKLPSNQIASELIYTINIATRPNAIFLQILILNTNQKP